MMEVLWAFLGSLGFALLFNMRGKQVWMAAFGGGVTWAVYSLLFNYMGGVFLCNCLAAGFVALYAELMARFAKAPTTLFLTCSAVPLIPGGNLYYTMRAIVYGDTINASFYGILTLKAALGIAVGFVVIAVLFKLIRQFDQCLDEKSNALNNNGN